MMLLAQALLMQLGGLFFPGSHCIAEHMVTIRVTGEHIIAHEPRQFAPHL